MSDQELQEIQELQFTNILLANEQLKNFLNSNLPFKVSKAEIRPLAVSLNSLNGFLTRETGERLFFKTHVEPKSIITEYYNSGILAEAGYPVIQPLYSSTEWGKQLLIYECINFPSLFDLARKLELPEENSQESIQENHIDSVISIQQKADDDLFKIYLNTLQRSSAKLDLDAPIHQLFSHRLTGGRFANFYQNKLIALPGHQIAFEQLSTYKWIINGIAFRDSLAEILQKATAVLAPGQQDLPTIIGHGDAHNGNVFIDEAQNALIYFDPAFAGRHSPFLDLTKPLFHNVFAIWMYFPEAVKQSLSFSLEIQQETIVLEHNFTPSPIRVAFLRSKLQRVLHPLINELKKLGWFADDWKTYLKLALFCCPFLTRNLADPEIFPPEITLLGLAMSIEMGSDSLSSQKSLMDSELDLAVNQ